ncbi:MAG: hypothetical protein IPJ54_09765 [Saprospiraceae bacterium]|nr:hypothetical protein [Saprospiraceae bacterium]
MEDILLKKENLIFENYATIGFGSFYNRAKFINSFIEDDDGKLDGDFSKIRSPIIFDIST